MEHTEFARLVRDALANLHDNAALEIHPLAMLLPSPSGGKTSRAERLRAVLLQGIEKLRPPQGIDPASDSIPWRPYLILWGRYVDGLDLQALEQRLALSTRHLCREHGRAVTALASLLWDEAFLSAEPLKAPASDTIDANALADELGDFEVTQETIDLAQALRATVDVLLRRAEAVGADLILSLPSNDLPPLQTDRIILRQILLTLLNYALRTRSEGAVVIGAEATSAHIALWTRYRAAGQPAAQMAEKEAALQVARYWAQRLGASFETKYVHPPSGLEQLTLSWPRGGQPAILVVDDQEVAIHLFERYLHRVPLRVVGIREPKQALAEARHLQPQAIILDVMMPTQDGWEVLQTLQADPDTSHIPVIICSVWDVPELASAYGAAGFVKKPVNRQDLLEALARLQLLDSSAGSHPADVEEPPPTLAGIGADAS